MERCAVAARRGFAFKRSFRRPYICPRCECRPPQQQRFYSDTTGATFPFPRPNSQISGHMNRGLLALHGHDAPSFLHGLTTTTVHPNPATPMGFYSCFLTATGRVLNDVFIYPASHSQKYRETLPETVKQKFGEDAPAYLVECDIGEVAALANHLKKYKLRAKLDIRILERGQWNIFSIWENDEPWTPHSAAPLDTWENELDLRTGGGAIGCVDARAPGMGRRLVLHKDDLQQVLAHIPETTANSYMVRRYLRGVPEGQIEIPSGSSLPQECNIDYMGGIDFKKGCYLGQELTIRTHHTGVVRKRMLPCMLYGVDEKPPVNLASDPDDYLANMSGKYVPDNLTISPANKKGRSAGKWVTGVNGLGLGLCRIEMMTDMVLTAEGTRWKPEDQFKIKWASSSPNLAESDAGNSIDAPGAGDEQTLMVKAFVPDWVRNQTKVQKPQIRV